MTDDINDVGHTSTLAKFEEAVRRPAQEALASIEEIEQIIRIEFYSTPVAARHAAERVYNFLEARAFVRAKTLARQTTTSGLPLCEGQAEECDGGLRSTPRSGQTKAVKPWTGNLSVDLRKGALSVNADGVTLIDEAGVCWALVFPDKNGFYEHASTIVDALSSAPSPGANTPEGLALLPEALAKIRLLESQVDSVSTWRLIETAPKDGTEIIGLFFRQWDADTKPTIYGPWTVSFRRGKWCSSWDGSQVIEHESDFGTSYKEPDVDPTHWLPMPNTSSIPSTERRDV